MSAIFKPSSNALARASIIVLGSVAGLALLALWGYWRTPYGRGLQEEIVQPVFFDHRHHVVDDLIDCRYCHFNVERGASAGVPSTEMCLNCHSQIWNRSPKLEPVRRSYFTGRPIEWNRVHQLPDFTYFNHSIHVAKGIGCATCHGPVHEMRLMRTAQPVQMRWCLDCHRNPEKYIRPKEEIYNMTWKAKDQEALGRELVKEYGVRPPAQITSCGTCHR